MRLITLLLLCLSLAGCAAWDTLGESFSGISDYFGGGEDNADPPHALVEYTPEIKIDVRWKESVGDGADEQMLKLVPAIGSARIIAADRNGIVQARDLISGDEIWEVKTGLPFSAGPGVGRNTAILGTSDAEVVALSADNGSQLWKIKVSSEVLAVPVVANGIVVVHTADGKVIAINESTGAKLWSYEVNVPALSIRGSATPVIIEDKVISGYDNGKLMALQLKDGKYIWESSVAVPKGRSEVERLVDLDTDPLEAAGTVYIAAYHGGVSAISEVDGEVVWRNESVSSYTGLSNDWRYLYLSDTESDVWQLDLRSGSSLWKQKDLHQRRTSAPAVYDHYVVVGDFEGYVHWLSTIDGHQLGRVQISDSPIEAKPVVVDNTVYVYAKDGTLAALTVQ
ncbi:MAG: outer membrane protein assembly factor BamB [Methylovulum sp.]|uniref:outer membrane protein assembly factor BamB n=1 Tax=Methylovulum sp. TaxID=1916980 RepID=UPI00260A675B|nr:outer membrane protein assembly factor BamB [Methylovulum sp.]MDD2724646.1 outer membrane protein assembly factor BamB [Methylovulum sp.]MDD5123473.1 outer membrane protein assembly factor BamB [Methylovulum sp.]